MTEDDLSYLAQAADTDVERSEVQAARDAYNQMVRLFEDKMLPALNSASAQLAQAANQAGSATNQITTTISSRWPKALPIRPRRSPKPPQRFWK